MLRFFDVTLSLFSLILLSPIFLIIALLIKIDSNGPIFYTQKRVGKNGVEFPLLKFRSMYMEADKAGYLTLGGNDSRITKMGSFIRKYKLDELPQLMNVLIGQMSMVGPRPEVKRFVDLYTEEQKAVLFFRPGITDIASVRYKNEDEILQKQNDPEKYYIEYILPEKLMLNKVFLMSPSIYNYFRIIFLTIKKVFIS